MATVIYDSLLADQWAGNVNTTHTFKGMLVTSAYTEDRGAHTKRSSITNEVTGTGYTAGGATITLSFAVNTTTHVGTLTIGAISWASSTLTARKLIVYRSRGGASSADELVCCVDNGIDVSSSASTLSISANQITYSLPAPF